MKSGQVKTGAGLKTFCIIAIGVGVVILALVAVPRISPRAANTRPFDREQAERDMAQWLLDNGVILSVDHEARPVVVVYQRAKWPAQNAREAERRTQLLYLYVADGEPVRVVGEDGAVLGEFDGQGPLLLGDSVR